jgi:hypothetical protein
VNKVLRKIFGPRKEQATGGWRNLHNEELHNIHSSPNIIIMIKIKEDEICETCSMHGIEEKLIQSSGIKT